MKSLATILLFLATVGLTACGGLGHNSSVPAELPAFTPLALTIAHINDHHSQLESFAGTQLELDGELTEVELGGFARVASVFKSYANRSDVIKLHAGDAITGTLYYTLFNGEVDAAMMKSVCFDAMVLGNHEFDGGDAGLKVFLDYLRAGTCKTPVLAANVRPGIGTPLAMTARDDYIKPYTIKTVNGVKVAIIGITGKDKTTKSSRPLDSTAFEDETAAAQGVIDQLKADGIRHFVLLTHQGYEADKAIAARLSDVDVIIGGDSHTLLGDFAALGLNGSGAYPTMVANRDGKPVCVAQAWEYGKAIGELNMQFDSKGDVESCNGRGALLIGSSFRRKDASGAFADVGEPTRQRILQAIKNVPAVRVTEPDAAVAAALSGYSMQVSVKKEETIGAASESLCLVRVPGEPANLSGGVAGCETASALARGSDVAQVVAEAFLSGSLAADVAVQNAGGVRVAMPAGRLSMNSAFSLLPFANVLVELRLTGRQLVDALEDAVANHLDARNSSGSHPYAAGLRWDLDMSKPRGARFFNVEVRNRATGAWSPVSLAQIYIVAANDYIASGKDGYTTFGEVFAKGDFVNNYLLYTQTFVDYVLARKTIGRPARADYSHQSVITPRGVVLP